MTTAAAAPRVLPPAARVAARAAALVAVAVLLAALTLPWRPATLCVLRAVTGVPCPFCGGTTAMVQLGSGRPLQALAASPLAALGAPLWVAWPALQRRARTWADAVGRRGTLLAGAAALTAAWVGQVVRLN